MKRIILLMVLIGIMFVISCGSKKDEIEDSYLIELENRYNENDETPVQTEISESTTDLDSGFTTGTTVDSQGSKSSSGSSYKSSSGSYKPSGGSYKPSSRSTTTSSEKPRTTYSTYTPKDQSTSRRVTTTYTSSAPSKIQKSSYSRPREFTSVWVDTKDSQVIKDVRLLIAEQKYREAQRYINRLNMENLPNTDVGHLYQFKGIVHYFLVPTDSSAFSVSIESFQKAYDVTGIDKFKPLSILWLGMLFERYSSNTVELQQAISLFDEIINNYANTRFVNDAIFYKALALKKLGRNSEYDALIMSLRNDTFQDNLIYSRWNKDYVKSDIVLSKYINNM